MPSKPIKTLWEQGHRIPLAKCLQIYNAQVTSVLLYSRNSWTSPKHELEKLDISQKHVKQILNIRWPTTIKNTTLYKRFNCTPLSERVSKARWTMLGHVPRQDTESPPNLALKFALTQENNFNGRIGCPRTNLLDVIRVNLESCDMKPIDCASLAHIRTLGPVNLFTSGILYFFRSPVWDYFQ